MGKRCQVIKKCQISTRHSNSTATIPDEEIYESTPNIFPTSFFWETHQFSYLIFLGIPPIFPTSFFLGNPPIFPTSFSWETHQFILPHFLGKPTIFPTSFFRKPTNISYLIFLGTHQFFLPHFFGKPTNFSYLTFLGNPPISPTSFSWETHQFFLPHFFGKSTNFSYLIFLGNPLNWLMKLLKKLHLMRFLATISVIFWNFCKLFTMKKGTIDTYKTTPPLLSYLIRVLRNLSLKI